MRKMDERDGYPKQPWRKEIYAKKGGKLTLDEKIDYICNKSQKKHYDTRTNNQPTETRMDST